MALLREDSPNGATTPARFGSGLRRLVERGFAWVSRVRRLARDYQPLRLRLPHIPAGLHFVALACLMLHRLLTV